jgi:hypothetical protein
MQSAYTLDGQVANLRVNNAQRKRVVRSVCVCDSSACRRCNRRRGRRRFQACQELGWPKKKE